MSLSTISAVNGPTRQARTGRAGGGTGRLAGVRPGTVAHPGRGREIVVWDRQTTTGAALLPVGRRQARRVVVGARLQRTRVSRAPAGRGDVTKERVLVADAARMRRSVRGVLVVVSVATVMSGRVRVGRGVRMRRSVPGVLVVSVATVMIGRVGVGRGVRVHRNVPGVLVVVSVATVMIGRVRVGRGVRVHRNVPGVLLVSVATVMIGHVRVVHGVKVRRNVPGVLLVSVATVMIGHVRVGRGVRVRRSVWGVLVVSVATVMIGRVRVGRGVRVRRSVRGVLVVSVATVTDPVNETGKRSKSDGASRPVWSRRRMNRNCPQAMTRPGSPARCGPSFVGSTSHWQAGWGATCVPSANWSIAIRNSHCGMPSWPAGWRPGYPWFAR